MPLKALFLVYLLLGAFPLKDYKTVFIMSSKRVPEVIWLLTVVTHPLLSDFPVI